MATQVRGISTRALQAEQTRAQILLTARRLFAEQGYDATSIQMIADEMGLTKAAVYYHFRAKSDMLKAVMLPGLQHISALLDEAESIRGKRARITYVINGFVDYYVENRCYAIMTSNDSAAKRHTPEDEAAAAELRQRALRLFFGEHPTGTERLAFSAVLCCTPDALPELGNLTDDELREALRTTMLHILRVPSHA